MQKFSKKLFSPRQFHAQLLPTLAYIMFMLLLLWLGYWQLDRAAQKTELFAAFASGDTEAMHLEDALEKAHPRYQRVQISGQFMQDKQYLIDNMVHKSQVGLHVLTPFKTDAGQIVLVNRGWISLAAKHGPLTDLGNLLNYSTITQNLTGRLDKMLRPGLLLETEIPDSVYPKTVQFPTFEQLSADLNESIVHWQLLLDAEPANSNVKAYVRDWSPHEIGPERHLGYALQWFALALTLTIIYLVLSFRPVRKSDSQVDNTQNN